MTLTTEPIKKTMMTMIAPASFGMLMTFLFQLVDTYFVGKLGTSQLAAVSFAYPIYILVVGLFMGIGAGISSVVGKALGEENTDKSKSIIMLSQVFFMILTVGIGVAGYYAITPVFSALGASTEMLPLVADYMEVIYLGMLFLVGTLITNASLMAKGVMIKTTIIMAIGGLVNLVLDYVLIFGMGSIPAMELQGAGLATVISWMVTFILMNILLLKEGLFSFSGFKNFAKAKTQLKEVLTIGGPAVAAQILNPIAIAVITRVVSKYGEEAIAAYGIATRVESLGLTGVLALSVIMTPLVAQNYGAKIMERIDQIIVYAGKTTVYWSIALLAILIFFSGNIAAIFTDNATVIANAKYYFIIVGLSFPGFGLALVSTSFFNGVYQPKKSLNLTLIKSLAFTIPLALLGSFWQLEGIWIGIAVANVLGAIYSDRLLKGWMRENNSSLVNANVIMAYMDDMKYVFSKLGWRK
ncbi:MAG: MATE family efflux transporter [Schleiferiaceae bacterium]|nr:MATE family efflux transporter [Schleiferiaceae bacterium]